MSDWTRRDVVKGGLASVGALTFGNETLFRLLRPGTVAAGMRERLLLDRGWRFHFGNAADPRRDFGFGEGEPFAKSGNLFAPSRRDFDDHDWLAIDLPHDWAVALPFVDDKELISHGCKPVGRDYPATSIGWYRRVFEIPATDVGRRLTVEFDGAYRDCMVALNGRFLGRNLSGYAPFRYDITDVANYGGPNVLVARVDATEREGWFYEGAGIYRHAWLLKTAPVHVAHGGTYVTSAVHGSSATLTIQTEVTNDADAPASVTAVSTVLDAGGHQVGATRRASLHLPAWSTRATTQQVGLSHPALWSPDHPHLYRLVTTILVGGTEVDHYETSFGVRTIRFDPNRGLFLNGERVELKGTCNHQDHAGVGSALPDRLQYFRIERLKAMGSNAYRTSHNPPTPELLDACDALGMLVLDETRMLSAEPEGLSQLERMVRRDRNRPSVFCWSLGNEEWREQGTERGARIVGAMKRLAKRLDPSRPVTVAMNGDWGKGISHVVDVQGCNYKGGRELDAFHRDFPAQPMMGTEVASTVSTRGIYANLPALGYVSAYDLNKPPWGATAEQWWTTYLARPFLAGGFVWTGFDYRGEPTPYGWPCINSHFGIMDTCGYPKDNFFYYKSWWGTEPVLHLFPHWNWGGREGEEIDVWCHTNVERVELWLNGKSLGAKDVARNAHVAWRVPYAPGTLEAKGYSGGALVLSDKRETTGPPARIALVPDRASIAADGEDVSVVEVRVLDAAGRIVPTAADDIVFAVTGTGALIGVGNGDPSSHEADKGTTRRAFNGLCVAIVQAGTEPGSIRVDASARGLSAASATITAAPATPRPAVP